jgi:apolipoprotein N-acyltransferase
MPVWMDRHKATLQMIFSGLLLGLSAPGFGLWPLTWVALIPAFMACRNQPSTKMRFGYGLGLGAAFGGLYYLWFFDLHPLAWLGFGEWESRLITLAGWLLLVLETALVTGLLLAVYGKLSLGKLGGWLRVGLFPLVWVLGFGLLNLTPLSLPWAQLEYTQASVWPMRFLAGLVSGSGVAALVVLHNCLWAEWFQGKMAVKKAFSGTDAGLALYSVFPFLLPLILSGLNALPEPTWNPRPWPIPVAVIQGNLPIETIRSGALDQKTIDKSYILPLQGVQWPVNTLLIYPEEGAAPGWTPVAMPYKNLKLFRLMALARQCHLYIAVGVSSIDSRNHRYNSLALITPDEAVLPEASVQFYHKRRLVPFGEFTPYGWGTLLTQVLNNLQVDYTTPYDAGLTSPLLQAGPVRLGGLICFELIDSAPWLGGFAQHYRQQGADLLINSSNLGWFHQNPLLENQFLAIGQLRAAETHLPLVISSNTGISAIISSQGQLLQQTHPNGQKEAKSQIIFYNGK